MASVSYAAALLLFTCMMVHMLQQVQGMLDPIDFLALQSIRKSLRDLPASEFFTSWDFTSDPCTFPGVYCSSDKVIALNLGDPRAGSPGLTGKLHPAIANLSALTELTVVPGRIYGPLPRSLSDLKNLRFLAISRNFISGDIPSGLGQLRHLRTLDLSYNQLNGVIPPSIGTLPKLTNLMLCHNHLSGPIPQLTMQTLTRLDLRHNVLSGSIPPGSLPSSLRFLSLSWNQLTGQMDQVLIQLNQINYLDLSLNQFTGLIPSQLFSYPLINLQLERNQFHGPIEPVEEVNIQTVDLSYNQLTGQISPMLASVQNLYLNNNKFIGQVPGSFVDQLLGAGIEILYLQHNYLTGIAINPAAEIPTSSSVCLLYNCMVPPIQMACPLRAGKQKIRPAEECNQWIG